MTKLEQVRLMPMHTAPSSADSEEAERGRAADLSKTFGLNMWLLAAHKC